ncbi:MAG: response regulator transcription factor [Lachnospiraceae bacterium]|jgi:DNA-binding response OmpR family regulator|nr:response regulator transcription factor [Lachnospiraceae bacterium]MCI8997192.1 response regulator transcription factor [Lachnospiraceae bacterium]
MRTIFYVEDDPDIGNRVREYLEQKGFGVTLCATLLQARQALEACVPACVLLDWNMPDGRGDHLCQWIRKKWRELPVIFLTVRGDSREIVSGFQSGADDYVVKPFELEVLYSRIQAVLRRTGNVANQYFSCKGITLDAARRTVSCQGKEISLSASEYDLLLFLMKHKGRTLTRESILEQVWDQNGSYVNDNTLTVTMKRLRDKLGQPDCLKTVRSVGYRLEDSL